MKEISLIGKKILVVGAGMSGSAAALAAKALGAEVALSDAKAEKDIKEDLAPLKAAGVALRFGAQAENLLDGVDCVIVSPAVPCRIPLIVAAKERGIKVISEIELAYRLAKSPIYAITGTNGKTTTTALTGEIFRTEFGEEKTGVGGNIGVPLVDEARRVGSDGAIVAEISSYQMEATSDFHPKISAILNVTPDHLVRHGSLEVYQQMKEKLFAQQTADEYTVLNYDDPATREIAYRLIKRRGDVVEEVVGVALFSAKETLDEFSPAAFCKGGTLFVRYDGKEEPLVKISELNIKGRHNVENALAAALIGALGGIKADNIRTALRAFQPVEHRIEPVRELDGVRYYNDSKATNTDSSIKALDSFTEPIILIAGGDDKMTDLTEFMALAKEKCKKIVMVGRAAERFTAAAIKAGISENDIIQAGFDMKKAVELCRANAESGYVVLLSPACASFDMFSCFEERGTVFKQLVQDLK